MRHGISFVALDNPPVGPMKQAEMSELFGLPIVYNPAAKGFAYARGFWPFKRIEVGPAWFALGDRERVAVLMHEAKHCLSLHLEKRVVLIPFFWTEFAAHYAERQELEADAFAVAQGYGVELLSFLTRFRHVNGEFYPHFTERADHLKRLMKGDAR